ncbi:unnamed protein product [Strongylus vulgaris]|uniref:SSD domain-containing protein n=1 Tax=Strongylus vulgaris TaxID=40348 RepID=A0A3P7IU17_STRVU|nr:unnamed protein product [Strongylus vulgaris]
MIQAGCSTIFCITPVLLIDSYMVYVFAKTIYLVIGLGLLHGVVFLPALLLTVRLTLLPPLDKCTKSVEISELKNTRQENIGKIGGCTGSLPFY